MKVNETDQLVAELVSEMTVAVDKAGALEACIAKRLDGSLEEATADKACTQVAEQFIVSVPTQTGFWEHLLVTLAFHSSRNHDQFGLSGCKSVIQNLNDLLVAKRLEHFSAPELVTLASAMTVVLAIQAKLTQDVEKAMHGICEGFPDAVAEIGEHCQNIWKRRGQMSGRPGLFLWDLSREEWRLAQDFKPYRPQA